MKYFTINITTMHIYILLVQSYNDFHLIYTYIKHPCFNVVYLSISPYSFFHTITKYNKLTTTPPYSYCTINNHYPLQFLLHTLINPTLHLNLLSPFYPTISLYSIIICIVKYITI